MPNGEDNVKKHQEQIRTKRDALLAKKDKSSHSAPRQPTSAPITQPQPRLLWASILAFGVVGSILLSGLFLPFAQPVAVEQQPLSLWIQGVELEYNQVEYWVSQEIANSGLAWEISPLVDRSNLYQALMAQSGPDLLLIERSLAKELHTAGALITLSDRMQPNTLDSVFEPLFAYRPWIRQIGWAIPHGADVEAARHLHTLMTHLSKPFVLP